MTDFFDDPDVRAQMARAGIVHKPGMARELMDELAPLLAAEGINMDNLDDDTDLETVNAAMARATEQHNLHLFTPIGVHRSGSLAVLRQCSEALASRDDERLRAVMATINPEPDGDTPAISHVIGVSLGLLDTWFGDPAPQAALRATRAPRWERAARAAATDILALARKGRAYDSLHSLIVRHNGLAVFQGGCLVVAASVVARAQHEGVTVAELAARVLVDGADASASPSIPAAAPPSPGAHSGAAFRRQSPAAVPPAPAAREVHGDRAVVRAFGAWLRQQPEIAAPTVEDETGMLEGLFRMARQIGLDPHHPDGAFELFAVLAEREAEGDTEAIPAALLTIDEYMHFCIETAEDPELWMVVHDDVEEMLGEGDELDDVRDAIESAVAATEQIEPALRSASLAQTRLVAATTELLAWIGSGQPVTQTGGLRRADIEHVAGLLGIAAIGVSKLPPPAVAHAQDAPVHVQSMYSLPVLAAWWDALLAADLIETTSTRVRPGPAAAQWSPTRPPVETAEMVLAAFVAQLIDSSARWTVLAGPPGAAAISRLLPAIAPDDFEPVDDGDIGEEGSLLESLLTGSARRALRTLESVGVLELDGPDDAVVPAALRAAVARGILLAIARFAADEVPE